MRRLLLLTFTIALVCGALVATFFLRVPSTLRTQAPTTAVATAPDSGSVDDSTDDSAPAWPNSAGSPEQVMYAQAQMMNDAIAKLAARAAGKVNLYFIAFAGDGDENVFRNEAEFAEKQFSQRFNNAGHTLLLINNPATLDQRPLATLTNLETAIDAIADKMDRDEDVLLLFLTSHGSRDHQLYIGLDPLPLDQIATQDIADIFTDAHIRYKVIVISACYSGGFIDALKDDTTMVITAARSDRASFGCGTDADITDFGRAFFVDGLNHNDSFTAAFAEASQRIDALETRDGEDHSWPQIATTPRIEAKLKAWRSGIHLGPPIPFVPPPRADDKDSLTAVH